MMSSKFISVFTSLLLSMLFLCPSDAFGQGVMLKGKVVDEESRAIIPFANLQVENTSIGTSSNEKGDYQLWVASSTLNSNILISCIGFKTKKVTVGSLMQSAEIRLVPESKRLQEVIVMPDSSLYVFLREAYQSISKNYLFAPYELKGFYREGLRTSEGRYAYFGEAELLLQAGGYQHSQEWGVIELLKSRTNTFSEMDSLEATAYYGGPFIAVRRDYVKERHPVLKPDRRLYSYELEGITSFDGKEVWIIAFKGRQSREVGKLFIERESKSYVRIERTRIFDDQDIDGLSLSQHRTLETWAQTTYKKEGGKWFVQYMGTRKRDYLKRLKKEVTITAEFNTTGLKTDSIEPIRFERRFDHMSVFSHVPNSLTENFWDGTTTISQDSALQHQLKPFFSKDESDTLKTASSVVNKASKNAEMERKLLRLVSRFGFSFGLTTIPYAPLTVDRRLDYQNKESLLSFAQSGTVMDIPLALKYETSFRISKRWQFFIGGATDVSGSFDYSNQIVGMRFSFLLKRLGNPILIRPEIAYHRSTFGITFPTFTNTDGFSFGGKNYNEEKLQLQVGEKLNAARVSLVVDKKIGGLKWIYLSVGGFVLNDHQMSLILSEKSGFFLFRKNYITSFDQASAQLYEEGKLSNTVSSWFVNLHVEMGLRLRL